jgi:hypothetical protein
MIRIVFYDVRSNYFNIFYLFFIYIRYNSCAAVCKYVQLSIWSRAHLEKLILKQSCPATRHGGALGEEV